MVNWPVGSTMRQMRGRNLVRLSYRVVIPCAIIAAVGWQFVMILRRPELQDFSYACRWQWLLPAGLLYLLAHTIWASFWWSLLHHQGYPASYLTGLRAYFVSQFGKYVPGKIWVILIRVILLGGSARDKAIVGVTATYEALTSMAAGAILGSILLPILGIKLLKFGAQNYILLAIAAIPLGVGLFHRLIIKIIRKKLGPDLHIPNLNLLILVRGLLQAAVGWCLLGLSLWLVLQAVRPETCQITLIDVTRMTAINCLSYVLGFIILVAPAGGGVREYVLKQLLSLELLSEMTQAHAEGLAVVVALVVRLVWTVAELCLALILYRMSPSEQRHQLLAAREDAAS